MAVWHVTSTRNRESILRHGLDWRHMSYALGIAGDETPEGECIFLARYEDEVDWFVGMSRSHHDAVDVWEVTLEHEPQDEVDGYLCVTEPIPAERVRLVRTDV
jgi:hypothetical protein